MKIQPYIIYDSQIFDQQKFGGISRYFCEIISKLQFKYDIAVRYTENHYLSQTKIAKHRLYIPYFLSKQYTQKLYRKNQRLTKKMLQSPIPYLYHPTYYDPSFLKYTGNSPLVVTVHDMIYERFSNLIEGSEEIIRQKREIITKANRIIAISEYTKKDIIDILNIAPEKIDVIYHGTSLRPSQEHNLPLPEQYILFVGDRTFYKNFQALLEAFSIVHQTNKKIHLVCTGKPFSDSELQQISNYNIASNIIQIATKDKDLNELYSRALLFVYPSYYEGFGIPILEVYACNCPVTLSNTTCFPEIAGDAGAFFNPYSINSIADTIINVISDKSKRTKLIKAGQERLKLYSWEKAARETENVYLKTLEEYIKLSSAGKTLI